MSRTRKRARADDSDPHLHQPSRPRNAATLPRKDALLRSDPEISLAAVADRVGLTVDGVRYHVEPVGSVREAGLTALRSFAPAR